MSWFLIAILGYFFLAVTFVLDKYILTNSVKKPVVYTFYSTIIMFAAFLAWPFGVGFLQGIDWLWGVVSGLGIGFGLWTLFIAVDKGETSHISPFQGAIVTISSYLISSAFLGETLSNLQFVGVGLLVFASFLLSFEKSRKHDGFHAGFLWAILSGIFFAISHVSAKYLYDVYPFLTGFVWTRGTAGLVGFWLYFIRLFVNLCLGTVQKKNKKQNKIYQKNMQFLLLSRTRLWLYWQ